MFLTRESTENPRNTLTIHQNISISRCFRISALVIWVLLLTHISFAGENKFLALCYHNVTTRLEGNQYSVYQWDFAQQMDYLKVHNYNVISVNDILAAHQNKKPLPRKAILLTFDDAYLSFHDFVLPVLRMYHYPAVLTVVPHWIEKQPTYVKEKLMSWEQLRDCVKSGLVEIASHTYDMHKGVVYNPQGNLGPACTSWIYDPKRKCFETDKEYILRLRNDFRTSKEIIRRKLGVSPRIMVWPYGEFNDLTVRLAQEEGFSLTFTLTEGFSSPSQLTLIHRALIHSKTTMADFIKGLRTGFIQPEYHRIAQVDLDMIYDSSPKQEEANLGLLIDRMVAMGVDEVYLQAFADPQGDGKIKEVYFPNRVFPVRSNLFSHAAHQLSIRDIKVYAWMPTIGWILPNQKDNKRLEVKEMTENGEIRTASSWYHRLSPFNPEVKKIIGMVYEDLGKYCHIDGVLFQDDAYLTDSEDFSPFAIKCYEKLLGKKISLEDLKKDPALKNRWTWIKTKTLDDFTECLINKVRKYRPQAKSARNIYASVVNNPEAQEWFSQNYGDFLRKYDSVVIMAYPVMEGTTDPKRWLRKLVNNTRKYPDSISKTVFKIQARDWKTSEWINSSLLRSELRLLESAGVRHLAYYPDDVFENKPDVNILKLEMSRRVFPYGGFISSYRNEIKAAR